MNPRVAGELAEARRRAKLCAEKWQQHADGSKSLVVSIDPPSGSREHTDRLNMKELGEEDGEMVPPAGPIMLVLLVVLFLYGLVGIGIFLWRHA